MAHIVVHRIEDLARRRLAIAWQEAARPGPGPRADTSLWQMTRVPFAHARTPRMMSRSVGKGTPAQQLLRDNPAAAAAIADQFPDLNLAELIVSPELPSEVQDALQTYAAEYDPSAPSDATLALYKPSGITRLLNHIITYVDANNDPQELRLAGPVASAPCIIKGVSWNIDNGGGISTQQLEVTPLGIIYADRTFDVPQHQMGGGGNMSHWVLSGSVQSIVYASAPGGFGGAQVRAQIQIILEGLERIA